MVRSRSRVSTLAYETGGRIVPVGSGLPTWRRRSAPSSASSDPPTCLYYTPRGVDAAGYHTIEVKVKAADARVQARRGYFGS